MSKKLTAIVLALSLSGCWTIATGEKTGYLVKLSQEGTIWTTWEGELIRGGQTDASGANGMRFDFTIEDAENSLMEKAIVLMEQNKRVIINYHCERFTAPWRGEHKCFVDSIGEPLK